MTIVQAVHHPACQMQGLRSRPCSHQYPVLHRRAAGIRTGRCAASQQDSPSGHSHSTGAARQQPVQRGMGVLLTTLLAASLVMGAAPGARAESAYEKRSADMERRRQQLASVREKALAKGGTSQEDSPPGAPSAPPPKEEAEAPPAAAVSEPALGAPQQPSRPIPEAAKPSPASAPTPPSTEPPQLKSAKAEREKSPPMTKQAQGQSVQDMIKASLGDYESFTKSPKDTIAAASPSPSLPTPAPAAEPPKPAEAAKSLFQQRPSTPAEPSGPKFPNAKTSNPPPPPPTPSPPPKAEPAKPAFTPGPRPEPPQQAKKLGAKPSVAAQAPAKGRGKQKGPLPMTLAQLVVLGIFSGIGYAFTAKAEASANLVQAAVDTLISVYQKLEDRLRKNSKNLPLAEKREPSGTDAVQPEAP